MKKQIPGAFSGDGEPALVGRKFGGSGQRSLYFNSNSLDFSRPADRGRFGGLYSYSPETEKLEWLAKSPWWIICAAVVNEIPYWVADMKTICSYDLVAGERKVIETEKRLVNSMAALDGILYYGDSPFGLGVGRLCSYNPKTGEQERIVDTFYHVNHMTASDGVLYYVEGSEEVWSYDPKICERERVARITDAVKCITALDEILYCGCGRTLCSYNLKTKKHEKVAEAEDSIKSMAAFDGNIYYNSNEGGIVYSYNPRTMKQEHVDTGGLKIDYVFAGQVP